MMWSTWKRLLVDIRQYSQASRARNATYRLTSSLCGSCLGPAPSVARSSARCGGSSRRRGGRSSLRSGRLYVPYFLSTARLVKRSPPLPGFSQARLSLLGNVRDGDAESTRPLLQRDLTTSVRELGEQDVH